MKVQNMKVGEVAVMGKYTVLMSHDAQPVPIRWLKASNDNVFISESALDYLTFDALERGYRSNTSYIESNIYQFLNSEELLWFSAQNENDNPPQYMYHSGFLYNFMDYEIYSLEEMTVKTTDYVGGLVHVPSISDIESFDLFKNKGVRPHPSRDYVLNKARAYYDPYFTTSSYMTTLLRDTHPTGGYIGFLSRSGNLSYTSCTDKFGIRPIIKIRTDTEFDTETREIIPFSTAQLYEEENLELLFGSL